MLIRLRPIAGPESTRDRFVETVRPFVFRHAIDPSVLRSVRDMKGLIESQRRAAGRDLDADLKEGPGGIRDVEFLVQSFQLFYGARHPDLRSGNVIETLRALEAHALLPPSATAALRDAYLWLRRAEHALQLAEEQQTARLPPAPADRIALARRMGYGEVESEAVLAAMLDDLHRVRRSVREHFENLVLGQAS